jgi:WD40 repeat protein
LVVARAVDFGVVIRTQLPTSDSAGLRWLPSSDALVVWDTHLQYKACVLDIDAGSAQATLRTEPYVAYEEALGIKDVSISPCGQFIALGSYDGAARVLAAGTAAKLADYFPPQELSESDDVHIYREAGGGVGNAHYEVVAPPLTIFRDDPKVGDATLAFGAHRLAWSADSAFLAVVEAAMPWAVYVFDTSALRLHSVLVHTSPVIGVAWAPDAPTLAVATSPTTVAALPADSVGDGGRSVWLWAPDGAAVNTIPAGESAGPPFAVRSLHWLPSGNALVVDGQSAFTVCFPFGSPEPPIAPEPASPAPEPGTTG